jgi:hypothetical protein
MGSVAAVLANLGEDNSGKKCLKEVKLQANEM